MFPCSHGKIFLRDKSRNFKNARRKGDRSGKNSKKQEGKNGGTKKKRIFFSICGGSHNRVFSIGREHPQASALV
jgi:hypothetical protein